MNRLFFQVMLALCASPLAAQFASLPRSAGKIVVIAHRGNHTRVPENTLEAIQQAIAAGVDYVEIDLRTTADGFLVLSHDASVDRMTNGSGSVKDLSLADIKQLQVTPTDTADKTIYRVPEFREILQACRRKMNIYLDFKEADVRKAWGQIKAAGMEKNIVVYLNKAEQYQQWRDAAPQMPLMASLPENVKTSGEFDDFFSRTPVEVVDNLPGAVVLPLLRKKKVAVWLDVESPDEDASLWQRALAQGVQGLQTDHPEALLEYLYQQNLRSRPAKPEN